MADHGANGVPAARPGTRWVWVAPAVVALAAGTVWVATRGSPAPAPAPTPLDGKLVVTLRSPKKGVEPLQAEESGALPAVPGGLMSLRAELDQPAFVYLVWLDTDGRVVPLYPWNDEGLTVTDADQPPPARKASKVVYSPSVIGGGWPLGKTPGLDTVLLLARRTPLDAGTKLAARLAFTPPPLRARDELVVLGLDRGTPSTLLSRNRGADADAADDQLRALMARLADTFELVRAVRFAHDGG